MHFKRILVGIGLAFSPCATIWCATPPRPCTASPVLAANVRAHPGSSSYSKLGSWFGERRQFDCAADAFRSALKFEPDSGRLHYLTGLSLISGGQPEAAATELEKAVAASPEVLQTHLLLATTLYQLHRLPQSQAEYESALKIDPKSEIAVAGICDVLLDEDDNMSVISLLRSAPLDANLALDLGVAYGRAGMYEEAAATLSDALAKAPGDLKLTNALVTVYVRQTNYGAAARLCEVAMVKHPEDRGAKIQYVKLLTLTGDREKAFPIARKLLASNPHDFDFLYINGVLEVENSNYDAARIHLEEAVTLNPKHYNSHYYLGVALQHLQDAKGAKTQLEQAIELGDGEPEVNFNLATVLRTLGETDAAREQLKLYQDKSKSKNERTLAATKSGEAATEYANGDPKKAAALYREALELTPQNAALAYKLAMALEKAGDTTAELAALEQAVKIDPDMALAQNQIGYLASRRGDAATAEQHFREALRVAPGYTQAWISLAATLGMESRLPEAKDAIANALRLEPDNAQALQLSQALSSASMPH